MRSSHRVHARAADRLRQVGAAAVVILAVGVLLYPAAARWSAGREQATRISGYVDDVRHLDDPAKQAELQRARRYDALLPPAVFGDPYLAGGELDESAPGVADYLDQLDATSVMARLRIPELGVDLPIYHGTSAETLNQGVGHLFGSSLPVGGAGSHAVLTGHSGVVGAPAFDPVHELERGDLFTIMVLDEVLTYRVDQIAVVEPTDTSDLAVVPGRDYVTLVTCTPVGVNSHRLLVRGERVETSAADTPTASMVLEAPAAGFPWWALGMGGGVVVACGAVALTGRRRHP